MKKEYDFAGAEKGKFYRDDVELWLPVYLDAEIRRFVENVAASRQCDVATAVSSKRRGLGQTVPLRFFFRSRSKSSVTSGSRTTRSPK